MKNSRIASPSSAAPDTSSYRTDETSASSVVQASRDYWYRRKWEREPKSSMYVADMSRSDEFKAEIARLEPTGQESFDFFAARQAQENYVDEDDYPPFNDMEIDTLLMVRTWLEYQRCEWLDFPMAGDVPGLQILRDEWKRRIYGDPTGAASTRPSPGDYFDLLDPEVRKAGLGYPSPPPLPAPWFDTFLPNRTRVWRHPELEEHLCLVDDNFGSWLWQDNGFLGFQKMLSSESVDDVSYEDSQDEELLESDIEPDDMSMYSQQPTQGRHITLRSDSAPPVKTAPDARRRKKRAPDPMLLERTHGLTADLSYRNRILVTEWALINVSRAGIHRAWASSGIFPYNPSAVLDTLTIEDAVEPETVARKTRFQEKKDIDKMISILQNPTIQASDKYAQLYMELNSAMRANNWQQRSIFADSKRQHRDDDEDDEDGMRAYDDGGILDSNAARLALAAEEAADALLAETKPHVCRECGKRYKLERGLKKHIQEKHTYCFGRDQEESGGWNVMNTERAQTNVAAAANNNGAKQIKVCPICGGNAKYKWKHEQSGMHRAAVEALHAPQ